jgi:citrate synthase
MAVERCVAWTNAAIIGSNDFAPVPLYRHLSVPPRSAFLFFAIGPSVSRIANALERRESGRIVRPRNVLNGATAGEFRARD